MKTIFMIAVSVLAMAYACSGPVKLKEEGDVNKQPPACVEVKYQSVQGVDTVCLQEPYDEVWLKRDGTLYVKNDGTNSIIAVGVRSYRMLVDEKSDTE